jgi:hypothetical protein
MQSSSCILAFHDMATHQPFGCLVGLNAIYEEEVRMHVRYV